MFPASFNALILVFTIFHTLNHQVLFLSALCILLNQFHTITLNLARITLVLVIIHYSSIIHSYVFSLADQSHPRHLISYY
jgi:hypothetical protein